VGLLAYIRILLVKDVEELYEKALNEISETHQQYGLVHRKLFVSYFHLKKFQKQQQLAMKRYKANGENMFLYWNVVCLFLQGIYASDASEKRLSFQLAEKIMEKLSNEGKLTRSEELLLYILILEEEKNHEKVMKMIQSPLIHLLKIENDQRMLELSTRKNLRQWKQVHDLCYADLVKQEEFTDWIYYDGYITAAIELAKEGDIERYQISPVKPHIRNRA
jgi:N-terminal acetyltransferase B complex non-catalytic subunit